MQIIKIPGINGKNSRGCERAGNAILEELKNTSVNEQGKPINTQLLDLEEIHLDNNNLKLTNRLIYENSFEAFDKQKMIFLGGDHSISFSTISAFMDYCQDNGKEPCLIVFDSHANCKSKSESELPDNENWLRLLIERGFAPENILLVGTRTFSQQELSFLKEKRVRMINANQLLEDIRDICDTIMEFSNGKELYVSLDVGVIDPSFAPAATHKESGGLTARQIIYLLQRINRVKGLRAFDIVEINVEKDKEFGSATTKLGAKILAELI